MHLGTVVVAILGALRECDIRSFVKFLVTLCVCLYCVADTLMGACSAILLLFSFAG